MQFTPIGVFRCAEQYPYDAARQAVLGENLGVVHLDKGRRLVEALRGLEGFSHIWLVYLFHQNPKWRPMIQPPRGRRKVGVFASRSPYRPNPIGISCVGLAGIDGHELTVQGHDLLDGTPIIDIKPYLVYADSFPSATSGWLAEAEKEPLFAVKIEAAAAERIAWLAERGVSCLEAFLHRQLEHDPSNGARKRIRKLSRADGLWEMAYRTWRAPFKIDHDGREVAILNVTSGYSPGDLTDSADPHKDKALHRDFIAHFPNQ